MTRLLAVVAALRRHRARPSDRVDGTPAADIEHIL
jgi:hypothetical protein